MHTIAIAWTRNPHSTLRYNKGHLLGKKGATLDWQVSMIHLVLSEFFRTGKLIIHPSNKTLLETLYMIYDEITSLV